MDTSTVTRDEIMQGVRALISMMRGVVFWSEVLGVLIVVATVVVISLIIYQVRLKRRDSKNINAVLTEVKHFLQNAEDHALLTDAQKTTMMDQMTAALAAARLQADKVAMVAKQTSTEVVTKLDAVPERTAVMTAEKMAEKLSTNDSHLGMPAPVSDGSKANRPAHGS